MRALCPATCPPEWLLAHACCIESVYKRQQQSVCREMGAGTTEQVGLRGSSAAEVTQAGYRGEEAAGGQAGVPTMDQWSPSASGC